MKRFQRRLLFRSKMELLSRSYGRSCRERSRYLIGILVKILQISLQVLLTIKSPFTSKHSIGVAEKAAQYARYIGYDVLDIEKMYLAGALHDIGKMMVGNEILEKPDKLTDEEFDKMKNHAGYTYLILSQVDDFEEIRDWAALHHEKLNGKGYPFGKTADELNEQERIMACVDIYQALTEERPYKKGMSHEKACDILDDMAKKRLC